MICISVECRIRRGEASRLSFGSVRLVRIVKPKILAKALVGDFAPRFDVGYGFIIGRELGRQRQDLGDGRGRIEKLAKQKARSAPRTGGEEARAIRRDRLTKNCSVPGFTGGSSEAGLELVQSKWPKRGSRAAEFCVMPE